MKKIVTILLTLSLCLSACVAFASCGKNNSETYHTPSSEHTFLEVWANNATYHWHACSVKGCDQITDKEEHTWDEGRVIAEPSIAMAGEIKYTCTACERTKVEPIPFEGYSADAWAAIIAKDKFTNFTLREASTVRRAVSGVEEILDTNICTSFTADKVISSGSTFLNGEDTVQISDSLSGSEAAAKRDQFYAKLVAFIGDVSKLEHDEGSSSMVQKEAFTVEYDSLKYTVSLVKIVLSKSGNIEQVSYSATYPETVDGVQKDVLEQAQWLFSEYGTTKAD